jgi:uncharacterized protein (DUF433 family)
MDATPSRNGTGPDDHPYVGEYPGVCGGYPVIRNTRIPVRLVVEFHRDGVSISKMHEMWPHVSKERIQGALDYYEKYPARVDEDIVRDEEAWAEIIERNVPIQGRPWSG